MEVIGELHSPSLQFKPTNAHNLIKITIILQNTSSYPFRVSQAHRQGAHSCTKQLLNSIHDIYQTELFTENSNWSSLFFRISRYMQKMLKQLFGTAVCFLKMGQRGRNMQQLVCYNINVILLKLCAFVGTNCNILLTAIGLTPGGSSTVHIYTRIIHRTTQ